LYGVSDTRQQIYLEADMFDLCLEVQKFVSICETIRSLLVEGRTLTSDEKGVIEFAARDLLTNLEHPCTRHLISKRSDYDGS
jgi:hypothetical protein